MTRVVTAAARRVNVPVRSVIVLHSHLANAAAFPLGGRLVFTSDILTTLDDEQLEAITAHELGHLSEPRLIVLARVALLASALVLPATTMLLVNSASGGVAGIPAAAVVFLTLFVLMRRLGRRMEERADRIARAACLVEPVYARALERLYERNVVLA